ncbi:MAG: hypothetical protein AB7P49_00280 [Bdellovibrionales bacterium]
MSSGYNFGLISLVVSVSGAVTALASLTISYLTYRRDSGRLDVYIGLGRIHGGPELTIAQDAIHLKIVNAGRRPVIISSFGGDNPYQVLNRILFPLLPKLFSPRAFIVTGGIYMPALLNNQDGTSKVLREGESSQVICPLPQCFSIATQLAEAGCVYAFDTVGRRHKVKRRVLSKLRKDLREYQREQRPI